MARFQPVLDTLLHPNQRAVRLELGDAPVSVVFLSLFGLLHLFGFLLVNHAVVVEVADLDGYFGFAFDVIATDD